MSIVALRRLRTATLRQTGLCVCGARWRDCLISILTLHVLLLFVYLLPLLPGLMVLLIMVLGWIVVSHNGRDDVGRRRPDVWSLLSLCCGVWLGVGAGADTNARPRSW